MGQGVSQLLGIFACLIASIQLLAPVSAQAESQPYPYAKALSLSEIIDVAQMEASVAYYVRTSEGLNVAFARETDALNAADLLNAMSDASGRCDKEVYQIALDEYVELTQYEYAEITQLGGGTVASDDGVFRLVSPRGDLSSLAKYVVPSFRACEIHIVARTSRRAGHVRHARTKLTRHRHAPLLSLL
jgi:hypothetical protein